MNELKNRGVKDVLIICADGLTGIKAVSYTHLDVYKRQDNISLCCCPSAFLPLVVEMLFVGCNWCIIIMLSPALFSGKSVSISDTRRRYR